MDYKEIAPELSRNFRLVTESIDNPLNNLA